MPALARLLAPLLFLAWPAAAQTPPAGQWQEIGIDRFGADYRALDVSIPAQCRAECQRDSVCQAYTVERESRPGRLVRRCWLKNAIPGARRDMRFESGIKGADPGLTIAVINMNNIAETFGLLWRERYFRVAAELRRVGVAPDVIALTETVAASSVWTGEATTRDWEAAEALHDGLRNQLRVQYRFASNTGLRVDISWIRQLGWMRGWQFQTQMLLYNPDRLLNVTPADVATSGLAQHDAPLAVAHLRASYPICDDPARRARLAPFIDGPLRSACGAMQPAGPAWNMLAPGPNQPVRRVGAFTRLAFPHEPDRFLEIYNIHPPNDLMQNPAIAAQIMGDLRRFMDDPKGVPDFQTRRLFPPLVVGDFQMEPGHGSWPALEAAVPHQVLPIPRGGALVRAILGDRGAFPSAYSARLVPGSVIVLPDDADGNCDFGGGAPLGQIFTNHCSIVFRLEWDEAQLQAADQAALAGLFRPIRPRWPIR